MSFRHIGQHLVFALSVCLLFVSVAIGQSDTNERQWRLLIRWTETVTGQIPRHYRVAATQRVKRR
jgi:hypothetical protein